MNRLHILLLATLVTHFSFGQKTESILSLQSGLFSFRGVSAEKTSQINLSASGTGYTNNPFGAKNGLSYGFAYQIQHITASHLVRGISVGYENLRSKIAINTINKSDNTGTSQDAATGRTYLSNNLINGFPFLGYRIYDSRLSVDLIGGLDIGYVLRSTEQGKATGSTGEIYHTSLDRTGIKMDSRARVQVSVFYGKAGAYVGYAHGLSNYKTGWIGGTNQVYSELIRFGLMYKLNG